MQRCQFFANKIESSLSKITQFNKDIEEQFLQILYMQLTQGNCQVYLTDNFSRKLTDQEEILEGFQKYIFGHNLNWKVKGICGNVNSTNIQPMSTRWLNITLTSDNIFPIDCHSDFQQFKENLLKLKKPGNDTGISGLCNFQTILNGMCLSINSL